MKVPKTLATLFLLAAPLSADITYLVTIDTTPLAGSPSGPFSLQFQLNDGSGPGDANNTVTVSNFTFGGGAAVADSAGGVGGASGDLGSAVTIADSGFYNAFQQQFTPGNSLSFLVTLTTNVDAGSVPDLFSFAILDSAGIEIPALSPDGALLDIDIDSSNPVPLAFGSDPNQSASGGDQWNLAAPEVTAPDPASIVAATGRRILVSPQPPSGVK